jgi:hypothetical protein
LFDPDEKLNLRNETCNDGRNDAVEYAFAVRRLARNNAKDKVAADIRPPLIVERKKLEI